MKKELNYQSYLVLIIALFCLGGARLGFLFSNGMIVTGTEVPDYMVVQSASGNDTLKVELKDQLVNTSVNDSIQDASYIHFEESKTIYHTNTSLLVWTILIVIMMSVAAGSFIFFIYETYMLSKRSQLGRKNIGIALVLSLLFFLVVKEFQYNGNGIITTNVVLNELNVLLSSGDALQWIVVTTIALQIPLFMTVCLISPAADRISFENGDKASLLRAADQFKRLEAILRRCLHVLAVLVVFSVLTSSTLSDSIEDVVTITGGFEILPDTVSLVYGLIFTFFLALIYLPVHFYLKYKGRLFIDRLNGFEPEEDGDDWMEGIEERFLIKQSALENIKIALAVVSPLLSSFLPDLIAF